MCKRGIWAVNLLFAIGVVSSSASPPPAEAEKLMGQVLCTTGLKRSRTSSKSRALVGVGASLCVGDRLETSEESGAVLELRPPSDLPETRPFRVVLGPRSALWLGDHRNSPNSEGGTTLVLGLKRGTLMVCASDPLLSRQCRVSNTWGDATLSGAGIMLVERAGELSDQGTLLVNLGGQVETLGAYQSIEQARRVAPGSRSPLGTSPPDGEGTKSLDLEEQADLVRGLAFEGCPASTCGLSTLPVAQPPATGERNSWLQGP